MRDPTKPPPWASGPSEILAHGFDLLQQDTDTSRRLAMIVIDNAVELAIKTYLGLPKRVTGLNISLSEHNRYSESFPKLLDALEEHASTKMAGIDLGEIEWYHRLRNQLYHQGNGLTVEKEKLIVYSQIASQLLSALFGYSPQLDQPSASEPVARFLSAWARVEGSLLTIASAAQLSIKTGEKPAQVGAGTLIRALKMAQLIPSDVATDLEVLRDLRNRVVHSVIGNEEEVSRAEARRMVQISKQLDELARSV